MVVDEIVVTDRVPDAILVLKLAVSEMDRLEARYWQAERRALDDPFSGTITDARTPISVERRAVLLVLLEDVIPRDGHVNRVTAGYGCPVIRPIVAGVPGILDEQVVRDGVVVRRDVDTGLQQRGAVDAALTNPVRDSMPTPVATV